MASGSKEGLSSRMDKEAKTDAGFREMDLDPLLLKMLRDFIEDRKEGFFIPDGERHNAQLAVGLGAAPIARFAQNDEAFSELQIEFSLTLKCFGTMVTTSQVEPRQNSVKCSSSAASTRSPFRYVPFAESRSHSRTMSWVTPTAQCKAETCGSSISMSAPPPARPMLVLALVSWYTRGLEGPPLVTEIDGHVSRST